MPEFFKNHWKSITWAVFIFILCGIPGNQISKVKIIDIPHFDKIVHFSFYFTFTLLLISENNSQKLQQKATIKAILIAGVISISYGILIEILQKLVFINRGAEIWDVVANAFGFILATLSYRLVNRITRGYI
ncbi:MAG: VanZ family protein [Bacteroidales bacterium]|nr:VanZ family protein [Bacteroidales bacterium]